MLLHALRMHITACICVFEPNNCHRLYSVEITECATVAPIGVLHSCTLVGYYGIRTNTVSHHIHTKKTFLYMHDIVP